MDGTAPTILPLELHHVLGTAAAPFSVDIRSADHISADDRMLPGGRIGCGTVKTFRRCGTNPLLQGRDDHGADRLHAAGTFCDLFRHLPMWLKKPGQTGPCAQ
jgi:hypothetical protein